MPFQPFDWRKYAIIDAEVRHQGIESKHFFVVVDVLKMGPHVGDCRSTNTQVSTTPKVVIAKSTLPVDFLKTTKTIMPENPQGLKFQVYSNPEFFAQGTAIEDIANPSIVLIVRK